MINEPLVHGTSLLTDLRLDTQYRRGDLNVPLLLATLRDFNLRNFTAPMVIRKSRKYPFKCYGDSREDGDAEKIIIGDL
jgi:hypothetical protein